MIRVSPIGSLDSKIIILGESPGKTELKKGVPFVGEAGKELNKLLASAGLNRDDCYITNTVKVMPPGSGDEKAAFFFKDGAPTLEYMQGIIELVGEIKTCQAEGGANVIVPLGNYALWALTQQSGIMKYRGSILESTLIPGLKVIPTIHPAYYTYQEAEFGNAHEKKLLGNWDFIRIAEQSKFPEIVRPSRKYITNPTPGEIEDAIEKYTDPSLEYLGADTEWYSPDNFAYIAFGVGTEEVICITPNSMLAYRAIKEILGSPIPKVWQNAMFDAVALHRLGIQVNNVVHDTMIEWFYTWGTVVGNKGLDVICSVLTEQPYYKDDVEFVGQDDRGQEYCCTDVAVMNEAHEKMQLEEFEITGTKKGYEISMTVMNTMIRAAQTGILVDQDKLFELKDKYLEDGQAANDRIFDATGYRINARSWQQVQKLVYDEMGLGKRFTKRSTAQEVLMDIAATLYAEDPESKTTKVLIDVVRERQNYNMVSRYVTEKVIDVDGRTRSNWNLAGTKNGRLSSTIPWWNGVALQTMPEDAREYCIADPGHVFIGWDLAQAEARVVAIKAHDYDLIEDMNNGLDIHLKMAAALPFGKTYEEHYAFMKENFLDKGKSKDAYEPRFLSKTTRHASNYIQSAYGLQRQINKKFLETMIGVNAAMSKTLADGFLSACPGLSGWWHEVLKTINDRGYLINAFGRRRNCYQYVHNMSHEHKDYVAFYPQSTIADLTTLSIAEVDKEKWTLPLLHMHDGGLIQVRKELKDDALELVKRTMTREFRVDNELLTVPVDLKWGYDWKNLQEVK